MSRISCPKCRHRKSYKIRRAKRRCFSCGFEWNPRALPLRLTKIQWRQILKWFALGLSSNQISEQTGITKPRIIRALNIVRIALSKDIPKQFSGIVEVDETYIGGKWINKRKSVRAKGTKRGRELPNSLRSEYCAAVVRFGQR